MPLICPHCKHQQAEASAAATMEMQCTNCQAVFPVNQDGVSDDKLFAMQTVVMDKEAADLLPTPDFAEDAPVAAAPSHPPRDAAIENETRILRRQAADETGLREGEFTRGYRLSRILGRGPRSIVYLGEQTVLRRSLVLKILKAEFIEQPDFVAQFLDAGRNAARLMHPHIAQIYDVVSSGQIHFIARTFVAGKTLTEFVTAARYLSLPQTCQLGHQLASALRYAHGMDYVHGNLSPNNCFCSDEGQALLVDGGHPPLPLGGLPATPAEEHRAIFAPPEMLRGEAASKRGDIYSLGALLYYALSGIPPYESQDFLAHVKNGNYHLPPPQVRERNQSVPVPLNALIEKMLVLDSDLRLGNLDALIDLCEKLKPGAGTDSTLVPTLGDTLHPTPTAEPTDRRRYRRLRNDMNVQIALRETSRNTATQYRKQLENVSESGAFVLTREPLSVGTFLDLDFNLDRTTRVHVLGVVRWVDTHTSASGMGVQFIEVSTSSRASLRTYVDKKATSEAVAGLTGTQLHRAILRLILKQPGQAIALERLARTTGSSQTLLLRALADFEQFGLVQINENGIDILPLNNADLLKSFAEALLD